MLLLIKADRGTNQRGCFVGIQHQGGSTYAARDDELTGDEYRKLTDGVVALLRSIGREEMAEKLAGMAKEDLERYVARLRQEQERGIDLLAGHQDALKRAAGNT